MRAILWITITSLFASIAASAQSRPDSQPVENPGLACFENLAPPDYPKTALQSLIDGSVWATIRVNRQGAPEKIETQVVSAWSEAVKLLTSPVEKVIRAAKIKPECAGKTVTVSFRYQIFGEATADPKVTSRTVGPGLMLIESQPALPTRRSM